MKVLITGATGFIGQYVYRRLLKSEHTVYAITRSLATQKINWFCVDILDDNKINELINLVKPDVLIHLAWDIIHGEFWNAEYNTKYADASKQLFSYFLESGGKKIIAAGSCAEYPTSDKPLKENGVYEGALTLYGNAKKAVFDYLHEEQKKEGFDFTWFRVFGVYGPGEDKRRFFPRAINSLINKEVLDMKTPNSYVNYIYVEDLANFIVNCISHSGLFAINLGTGDSLSILDLYSTLEHFVNTRAYKMIRNNFIPGLQSRIPDCNKLHKHGFNFELENGFQQTVKYFERNI